jgi:hypothetical protein
MLKLMVLLALLLSTAAQAAEATVTLTVKKLT